MTLTVDSFKEFISYKKDLRKTLRTCLDSKYTVIACTMGDKKRNLIVCGKTHDTLMKGLHQLDLIDNVLGKGNYEASTFHPLSGKSVMPKILKELGIDDLTSIYTKKLDKTELIPGASVTWVGFEELIQLAEEQVKKVTHPKVKERFAKAIKSAKERLAGFAEEEYDEAERDVIALKHWAKMEALYLKLDKEIAHWLSIAEEQNKDAHELLKSAQVKLKGVDINSAAADVEKALQLFKSQVDFAPTTRITGGNDITESLNNSVKKATGLGDLYDQAKKKTVSGIAETLKNPHSKIYESTKTLAQHLPTLFKADLKEKLLAVDKLADESLDQRRKIIEKALVATRQYITGLSDEKVKNSEAAILFNETLRHIHQQLMTLHGASSSHAKN
jgi:tetratricopeptide (TPR) repeat protein